MEISRIYLIMLFIFTLNLTDSDSQSSVSDKIDLNIKVRIMEYMNNIDSIDDINNFMSTRLNYRILQHRGFSNDILFIEVPISLSKETNYKFFIEGNFVFAYRKRNDAIFKMKGFEYNEFGRLLAILGPEDFEASEYVTSRDLLTFRQFKKTFWVEDLDINCLYLSLKEKKKRKKGMSPCLEPIRLFSGYPEFIPD